MLPRGAPRGRDDGLWEGGWRLLEVGWMAACEATDCSFHLHSRGSPAPFSGALEPWGIVKLGAWTVATAADSSASWKRPALVRGMISFFLALPAEPSLGFFNFLALRLRNKLYQLIVSGEPRSPTRGVLCFVLLVEIACFRANLKNFFRPPLQ